MPCSGFVLLIAYVTVYYEYHHVSVLFLMSVWCPCISINVVNVQYNGGLLPDIILLLTVDPMLLPSGNPFKCHEEFFFCIICSL